MSTFSARVWELIGGERRRSAFARECGLPEATIRQYLAGSVPGLDKVIQIARAKNVRVEWLATGEGPRDIQPEGALSRNRTGQEQTAGEMVQRQGSTSLRSGMVLLPRLSVEASAGQGIVPEDDELEGFLALKAEFLRDLGVNPNNAHVLKIKGDSMYPTLKDKDIIIIDASIIEALEEGLYTLILGDVVKAKRLQPLANGSIRIISDNQTEGYRDEIVQRRDLVNLRIVGRIRGIYRNL